MVKTLRSRFREDIRPGGAATATTTTTVESPRLRELRKSRRLSSAASRSAAALPSSFVSVPAASSVSTRDSSEELSDIAPEIVVWTDEMDVDTPLNEEVAEPPSDIE